MAAAIISASTSGSPWVSDSVNILRIVSTANAATHLGRLHVNIATRELFADGDAKAVAARPGSKTVDDILRLQPGVIALFVGCLCMPGQAAGWQ
jgi:hypothetical protein